MERRPDSTRPVYPLLAALLGIITLILFTFVLDLVGVANTLREGFPLGLPEYAQMVSAFTSMLLTFALVVLYDQQTRIQRRQEVWMEAEHTPDLFVRDWGVTGDEFEATLSNLGPGVAQSITARLVVRAEQSSAAFVGTTELVQADGPASVLRPDHRTLLCGVFETFHPVDGEEDLTVEELFERLRRETARVEVRVELGYDYVRQESDRKSVFCWHADLAEVERIEDLVVAFERSADSQLDVTPTNLS